MEKYPVAVIAVALALVIGFACGALLTKPDNLVMERLVNEKETLQKEIKNMEMQIVTLQGEVATKKKEVEKLRNELLNALRQKTETRKFNY
jgi:peptidoglycan hydrolase CwlO-like protein